MKKINWAREMSILGDIDPIPEYNNIVVPTTFTGVWCQNVKKHPLVRHPTSHIPMRMRPIECEKREVIVNDPNPVFFCPVCKEDVDVNPLEMASWGEVGTRAGFPKSMTMKL